MSCLPTLHYQHTLVSHLFANDGLLGSANTRCPKHQAIALSLFNTRFNRVGKYTKPSHDMVYISVSYISAGQLQAGYPPPLPSSKEIFRRKLTESRNWRLHICY